MRTIGAVFAVGVMVACSAATAGAASGPARCAPTPNDGGGPDRGTGPSLRAKIGTGHVLTGVVLSPSCAPIPGARVSFWQSNAKGIYTTAGRGAVVTDRSGGFRFEGPMPTAYGGRPGHIHIRVEATDYETLYTEYEPRGTRHGSVRLVLLPSAL